MKIEHSQVFNFDGALRGMRNPKNSWDRSDTIFYKKDEELELNGQSLGDKSPFNIYIGPNDMKLAKTLYSGGPVHRKFLRQILVSVDITAPLYWWKEMDTYKVGTVANSTSTMHKITSNPITLDCFETDDLSDLDLIIPLVGTEVTLEQAKNAFIDICEGLRIKYLETKDIRYWKELIRWLPEGWLQTRTWTCNYETLANIYQWRKNHKLTEWHTFCEWIESLPYAKELIIGEEKNNDER